jgi:Protein of unknown function (DUF3175)
MPTKATTRKAPAALRRGKRPQATPRRWSKRVTETSNALDLEPGVFRRTPRAIALSLKRSAERSRRRKADPFRSAMSMLNLYLNRAGKNLSAERRRSLNRAKAELRKVFHRDATR